MSILNCAGAGGGGGVNNPMTENLDANGFQINNLGDGVLDGDATNLGQVNAALALKIDLTEKGAANGVAELDGDNFVPPNQLDFASGLDVENGVVDKILDAAKVSTDSVLLTPSNQLVPTQLAMTTYTNNTFQKVITSAVVIQQASDLIPYIVGLDILLNQPGQNAAFIFDGVINLDELGIPGIRLAFSIGRVELWGIAPSTCPIIKVFDADPIMREISNNSVGISVNNLTFSNYAADGLIEEFNNPLVAFEANNCIFDVGISNLKNCLSYERVSGSIGSGSFIVNDWVGGTEAAIRMERVAVLPANNIGVTLESPVEIPQYLCDNPRESISDFNEIILSKDNGIYSSIDGGTTYNPVSGINDPGGRGLCLHRNFLMIGSDDGLNLANPANTVLPTRSYLGLTDFGLGLSNVSVTNAWMLHEESLMLNVLMLATDGDGLLLSANSGATWTQFTTADGLASNNLRDVKAYDESGNFVTVVTTIDAGLSVSADSWASWTTLNSGNTAAITSNIGWSTTFNFTNKTWVASTANEIVRVDATTSSDILVPANWTNVQATGFNFLFNERNTSSTFRGLSNGQGLWESLNDGVGWAQLATTAQGLGANTGFGMTTDNNGQTIYAGTTAGISISTDNGVSFVNTAVGGGDLNIRKVEVARDGALKRSGLAGVKNGQINGGNLDAIESKRTINFDETTPGWVFRSVEAKNGTDTILTSRIEGRFLLSSGATPTVIIAADTWQPITLDPSVIFSTDSEKFISVTPANGRYQYIGKVPIKISQFTSLVLTISSSTQVYQIANTVNGADPTTIPNNNVLAIEGENRIKGISLSDVGIEVQPLDIIEPYILQFGGAPKNPTFVTFDNSSKATP